VFQLVSTAEVGFENWVFTDISHGLSERHKAFKRRSDNNPKNSAVKNQKHVPNDRVYFVVVDRDKI
jgi:hypothetical protein